MQRLAKILLIFTFACFPRFAHAADLTLAWDAPSDGVAAGYVISYGTVSRTYSLHTNVGNTTSYTVRNLSVGTTYYFVVSAYDGAGRTSVPSIEISARIAAPVVTALTLTSNVAPPQIVGTAVTWLAIANGGVAPYQYQWALYGGGKWTTWPWTNASTWLWTPSTPGTDYQVKVAVRSAGSTSTVGEMVQSVPFRVTARVGSVTLQPSVASPQMVGTTIRWSATVSGGGTGYQYRWFVFNGTGWSGMTGWTTSATWSWVPTVPNNGYLVAVWVRTAGSSIDVPEASAAAPYSIKAPSVASSTCAVGSICK